jgi:hypothetical protein
MRLYECQACGQLLFFENSTCQSCGRNLGFLPSKMTLSALERNGDYWNALADPGSEYVYCANVAFDGCNWLIPSNSGDTFCTACRHNRTIPDLSDRRNLRLWRKVEIAKRRLFYSLLRLGLVLDGKNQHPAGLAFDFLAPTDQPVMTGHLEGVITINLGEADDSERERQRGALDEPYRTLLGHFRHEIAHYYWDVLVRDSDSINEFREIFGDERADYGEALRRHHREGAPVDWPNNFVTSYASSHPWEDFAETWAQYFHIIDTLETAQAFGVHTRPGLKNAALAASVDFDPYTASIDRLIDAWLPLTFAFNSINRSMGFGDLYPFVLSVPSMLKLNYVYNRIHRHASSGDQNERATLKAVVASLKRGVASP